MRILSFRPSHMPAILAIERASFAAEAYPESLFQLYAAGRQNIFLVARSGSAIAGYIIARPDRWGGEIVSLAVDPSWRRRGIGTALLASAIRRLRRRNIQSIRLMVHLTNTRAAAFYRRQGFQPTGRVPDYYEDGGTAVRMRLRLSKMETNGRRNAAP